MDDDGGCSRLEIRNGLGVRSGSPKPPLATALLDNLLETVTIIDMVTCVKHQTRMMDSYPALALRVVGLCFTLSGRSTPKGVFSGIGCLPLVP